MIKKSSMLIFSFLFILNISSCASLFNNSDSDGSNSKNSKFQVVPVQKFNYSDPSGKFLYVRESRIASGKKLVTRGRLISLVDEKELESQISISKIGSNAKGERVLLPDVSQFKIWFKKKKYISQLKVYSEKMRLNLISKGVEERWNLKKSFELPAGKYFCFFSQLPECLKAQNLLLKSARKKVALFVIWDNFPYHSELYEGMSDQPIVGATVKLDRHDENYLVYVVDIGSQIIFYHYDKNLNFKKMFWISQGIRITEESLEIDDKIFEE